MAKRKYVYFGEIDRFGYTWQCITLTEEECREAMIAEYIRMYKKENGTNPKEAYDWMEANKVREDLEELDEYYDYETDAEYFSDFLEELYIEKRELGVVEWV